MLLSQNVTMDVLISAVDKIREKLNISLSDYPIDLFEIISKYPYLSIIEHDFDSTALGGFLIRNKQPDESVIIINSNNNFVDKNFALGHEIIHFFCHSGDSESKMIAMQHKNTFKSHTESQANEGAAELLVPAKLFIEEIKTAIIYYGDKKTAFQETAKIYHVASEVIKYRYYNLNMDK